VDRSSLWRSRISGAPLHFVTRCTASGTRDSVRRVRNLIHFSNSPSRSRGALLRPGFATLASLTPNRGVGGAPRNVRVRARHPWGTPSCVKERVNALMTRRARRLRGALRPMTRDARLSALHRGFALPLIPAQAGIQVLGPRLRGDERKETYATPRSAFRIVSRTRPQ
jgi:hypothetical protein